jgi:phosphoribosylglycinamide formyltransferase-1
VSAQTLRLGVLISGSGSNLQAIIDAIEAGNLDATVVVVISSRSDAYGMQRARSHGIEAVWVDRDAYADAAGYNAAIRDELQSYDVDYVVMAGYMRLLGTEVLNAYPHRVLNLHPALLPSFPGAHGIADALAYGVKVTGITVHFADEVFDRGPIIAQRAIEIAEDDTLESLEAKIHAAEHELYPAVLQLIATGCVRIEERVVHIAEA